MTVKQLSALRYLTNKLRPNEEGIKRLLESVAIAQCTIITRSLIIKTRGHLLLLSLADSTVDNISFESI